MNAYKNGFDVKKKEKSVMKLKQGTDLAKYGFKHEALDKTYYLECKTLDSNGFELTNYIEVLEDNSVVIHTQFSADVSEGWTDVISEIPSVLIKMIRDGVIV